MMKPDEELAFEEAITELTSIVQSLERGQPTLEESLAHFERGIRLLRTCRSRLDVAEARVKELVDIDEHGHARLRDFDHQASIDASNATPKSSPKKRRAPAKGSPADEEKTEGDSGLF